VSTAAFIGVYSSLTLWPTEERAPAKRKQYWFVWDNGDGGYSVQSLDGAFTPQGEVLAVDASTLSASFSLEPTILVAPMGRSPVSAAPSPPQPEQQAAAYAEVENFLRKHFGSLLLKIKRGDDLPASLQALQDLAEVEEGIVPAHKFMFAEFGINLRKGRLPEIALAHAKRVLSLAPSDGHAHFNIARIYHTLGRLGEAEQHLLAALEFAPDLEYARDFIAYIGKERHRTKLDARKDRRW
jgi:tetratricopeptide (TPR) repeat protein